MLFGASISLLQETKQRSNATISNKSIMIFPVLAASISLVVSSFQSIRVGSACADNAMVLIPYATQSCRGLIAHHSWEKGKRSRKRWLYSQQIGNWLSKSISISVVQCPLKSAEITMTMVTKAWRGRGEWGERDGVGPGRGRSLLSQAMVTNAQVEHFRILKGNYISTHNTRLQRSPLFYTYGK